MIDTGLKDKVVVVTRLGLQNAMQVVLALRRLYTLQPS